ncbi:hypothetical protein NCCP436_08550 [Pseudomonas sp. NCCP-436]|nr:hypothetical protein NCCP436_08550 [Pseudomonas sp. NCCP-436]
MRTALGPGTAGDKGFQAARQALCAQTGDGMGDWLGHRERRLQTGAQSITLRPVAAGLHPEKR